ncbi:MAG: hypothetical protein GF383_15870 [Candidatus Lokiarchaeota archaeon]|nr:hypothetical protein [Candidatus Lokiarchaeota archaeon]
MGETRDKSVFLLFPRSIKGEMRWLETVIIRQRLEEIGDINAEDVNARLEYKWVDKEYLD